jgi:hypothetical protein
MRDDKDRSGKWLIGHCGDALLRLAGVSGFRAWRAVAADVVQPRQLPDGLLDVFFNDRSEPDPFLVEIATYPEERLEEQVLRDALLVWLDRRVLPEVVTLVLHPRGNLRLSGTQQQTSRHGWTTIACTWRVVELWTVSAADLLAANDVGLIPWVPLARFDEAPEVILRQCRERIDLQAPRDWRANLLAVTLVMTRLRYNDPQLLAILGGSQVMIESPLIQEIIDQTVQKTMHKVILGDLETRFGPVPAGVSEEVRKVREEERLHDLQKFAMLCPDLASFQARLMDGAASR